MLNVETMQPILFDIITIGTVLIVGGALIGFTLKKIMQWFVRAFG